jgi:hypothetical protein
VVFLLWLIGGLALIATVVGLSFRIAWQRSVAGLEIPAQVWEKTSRLASWASLGPKPQQTPREYAQTLGRQMPDVEGLDFLAESYGRSQFGRKKPTAEESTRISQIWAQVRSKLLSRMLHWK